MKSQMEPSGAIGPARVSVSVYIDHDIWVLIEVRNTYTLENNIVDRPVPNIQICSRIIQIIYSHFISLIYSALFKLRTPIILIHTQH